MEFGDLFSFDKKIAPAIIKPIYWIGLLLIPFLGIVYFFSGFFKLFQIGFFTGIWDMCASIIFVILGVLGLRIAAEIGLAVFETQDKVGPSGPPSV
jgi:hypothetical protein